MIFDFNQFVENLHGKDPDKLPIEALRQLLNLGDDYTRDTPVSTGKRLVLNRIGFWGKKISSEDQPYNNDIISYSQKIEAGVNIWIASNLKGKSSIFKIIKFALTGRNKIKPNIKKWLHQILLNFSINEKSYTIYLDTRKILKATLFNGTVDEIGQVALHADDIIFFATGEASYEKMIEDFFFNQFSYYSLKWTQKTSQKDKDELLEAGASWITYFESIFLESRDSGNLMYGAQSKKIFQMLLGLEFTYPINRLSVEKDKLQYEKARHTSAIEAQVNKKKNDTAQLQTRLTEIDNELSALTDGKAAIDTDRLVKRYEELIQEIQVHNTKLLAADGKIQTTRARLSEIASTRDWHADEIHRVKKEIQKTNKRISDLEEFVQIGIFFSNLDIKHCPNCDHTVTEERKVAAAQSKTCSLCNDPIIDSENINAEEYQAKIENLRIVKQHLIKELEKLGQDNSQELYDSTYRTVIRLEQERLEFTSIESLNMELQEIQQQLETERSRPKPNKKRNDELVAEKAVITYRLDEETASISSSTDRIDAEIYFLSEAIAELNSQRSRLSDRVLKRLGALMLAEIRQLGLTSITEVTITPAFDVKYKQDGEMISFDDIAEGEQLRAKIAFYMSLIQMDIENNFGRHTRFLILDSPAKEEVDDDYMEGLSEILQTIDSRFGDNLQILIGTAERSLTDVVTNQYVTPQGQFVF